MAGGLGGADGGNGGDGGEVNINLITGGDIILGAGPAPNTSFSPTNLNKAPTELGANPLVVTADMTLTYVAAFGSKPAAGTYYLSGAGGGGYNIRKSDGDLAAFNAAEVVSGLEIARGATLTVSPNDGATLAQLNLVHDVIVKGTLASAEVSATVVSNLELNAASVLIHRSGTVTTAASQPGQNAGYIDIYPDYSFINQGKVLSYGADNAAGAAGDGAYQYVDADYYFENTGLMDAHGGRSRSEEHTSEPQSRPHLVCRLLLEKKKKMKYVNGAIRIRPSCTMSRGCIHPARSVRNPQASGSDRHAITPASALYCSHILRASHSS